MSHFLINNLSIQVKALRRAGCLFYNPPEGLQGLNASMLNERAQNLLKILVEHYISSGEPVASKSLAVDSKVGLSAATVRHVLADLEAEGYIKSPHTSSGRVPTNMGYRFFIDGLIAVRDYDDVNSQAVSQWHEVNKTPETLLQSASMVLSDLTQFAGIVTLPKRNKIVLTHVDFLSLSNNRVLSILVFNTGEVENRMIHTSKKITRSELEKAANYINQHYAGLSLLDLRAALLVSMQSDKTELNNLLHSVLEVADKAIAKNDYHIGGQNNLMRAKNSQDILKLKALFDVFSEKSGILLLLDQCLDSDGIQIFVGEESGQSALGDHSLVVSTYRASENVVGVLGVIGPTRMRYERVIPIVDVTAKLLSAALNKS